MRGYSSRDRVFIKTPVEMRTSKTLFLKFKRNAPHNAAAVDECAREPRRQCERIHRDADETSA